MSGNRLARLTRSERLLPAPPPFSPLLGRYPDPYDYARHILKVDWWQAQREGAAALLKPPYKVEMKSCHKVGKSFLAACLICWHFDTFAPSLTITTAPTKEAVCDQLWREVRILRQRAGLGAFVGDAAPELYRAPDHWAKGITSAKGEAFQGKHQEHMLFIIDEAVGVAPWVFDVIRSMFKPTGKHHWLIIGNPTDTTSQMYAEELSVDLEGRPAWTTLTMAAPDHPNLAAGLRGEPPPFPAAVDLPQFESWLAQWFDPIAADEHRATDLEWPPGSNVWYRPGPLGESRALGRWPSQSTYGVWSDGLFNSIEYLLLEPGPADVPEIGCDPARFGDDYTAIHSRCGPVSLAHERHNGWDTKQTAGRLKQLCREYATWANARRDPAMPPLPAEKILVKVDVDGLGAGVVDQRDGYAFVGVSGASTARRPADYPNVRSEAWFHTARLADRGRISLARLDQATRRLLRRQALSPEWWVDGQGRCLVEPKSETKKRLQASPDDMDALNLAYWDAGPFTPPKPVPNPSPSTRPHEDGQAARMGLFGRRA